MLVVTELHAAGESRLTHFLTPPNINPARLRLLGEAESGRGGFHQRCLKPWPN